MKRLLAAAAAGLFLSSGGVIGYFAYQNHQDAKLSLDFAKVLEEFLIAAKSHCKQNTCLAENVISQYFRASKIKIENISEFFAYLKKLENERNLLDSISNSWMSDIRGSKFWWLVYDAKEPKNSDFALEIMNLQIDKAHFEPIKILLSKDSAELLRSFGDGIDFRLKSSGNFKLLSLLIDGKYYSYELLGGSLKCRNSCKFDPLFSELARLFVK